LYWNEPGLSQSKVKSRFERLLNEINLIGTKDAVLGNMCRKCRLLGDGVETSLRNELLNNLNVKIVD
jgi:hypothetical protein